MSSGGCWPRKACVSDDRLGSVAEIAGAVRAGDVSCRGVAQSFLERAHAANAVLNCFIELDGDAAIGRAAALDRELDDRRGPAALIGVPFAAKDIFTTAEHRPSNG